MLNPKLQENNFVEYELSGEIFRRDWRSTPYGTQFHYNRHSQPFVLMSYNILAQDLLTQHQYLYEQCDKSALKWSHRLQCLKREIEAVQPAILCLQEVQETHLDDIAYALHELGFAEPLYKKRTGNQFDGCAIFFNQNLFRLIDCHFVEYFQPDVKVCCTSANFIFHEFYNRSFCFFLNRCSTVITSPL